MAPVSIPSGIPGLDDVLRGGIPARRFYLIKGIPGSGKTTLGLQFLLDGSQRGERTLYITLSESRDELDAVAESHGWNLKNVTVFEMGINDEPIQNEDQTLFHPAEVDLHLKRDVESGARMVGIDSLSGYMQAMPEEKHLHLHLHELLTYLNQQNIVSFLTLAQSGMMAPMQATDISYIADNVILIRFFEAFGRVKKAISVVKKRNGGHEDTIRELLMTDGKIQVGKPLEKFRGVLRGVPSYIGKAEDILESSDP